jgi:hypothetical protein
MTSSANPPSLDVDVWRRGLLDPVVFAERILQLELHRGQKRWLRQSWQRENILVTGNRWGKSFVSAVKVIHHAIYRPRARRFDRAGRYRIVVASITQDQANIIFDQVRRLINERLWLKALVTRSVRTPIPRIWFGNGSVIEARSTQNRGHYLLGHDYDLFIFDEIAFEPDPDYMVEEVIQMRLADRAGRLDLVSTPNGRGWFSRRADKIIGGRCSGYVQGGDSRENTFIDRGFLDDRLRYFSERRIEQNIMGRFVDVGGEVIPGRYIDAALARGEQEGVKGVFGDADGRYLTGWDLARKETATVGITIALHNGLATVVALERLRRFDWNVVIERIKQRQLAFPGQLIVDATGLGDVVVEQLAEWHPDAIVFTPQTKAELLTNVELWHARGRLAYSRWELPDGPGRVWSLEDELRSARWDDNNRCDSLMALALALWPLRRRDRIAAGARIGKV